MALSPGVSADGAETHLISILGCRRPISSQLIILGKTQKGYEHFFAGVTLMNSQLAATTAFHCFSLLVYSFSLLFIVFLIAFHCFSLLFKLYFFYCFSLIFITVSLVFNAFPLLIYCLSLFLIAFPLLFNAFRFPFIAFHGFSLLLIAFPLCFSLFFYCFSIAFHYFLLRLHCFSLSSHCISLLFIEFH